VCAQRSATLAPQRALTPRRCRWPWVDVRAAAPLQTANAVAWMREMMDYNVPLGKLNRGLAVLDGARRCARASHVAVLTHTHPAAQACARCTPRAP
jgi:hypothetical protein